LSFLPQSNNTFFNPEQKKKQTEEKKKKKLQKKKISARFSVLGVASKLHQINQNLPRNHFWSQGIGGQI
jgi:hypothetical protein